MTDRIEEIAREHGENEMMPGYTGIPLHKQRGELLECISDQLYEIKMLREQVREYTEKNDPESVRHSTEIAAEGIQEILEIFIETTGFKAYPSVTYRTTQTPEVKLMLEKMDAE